MDISQFFIKGDIKGAIEYMKQHEEYKDVLPLYIDIFENCNYRKYEIEDKLNQILLQYQIYYRDIFYCGLGAVYIIYLHRENIKRLIAGNENKVR